MVHIDRQIVNPRIALQVHAVGHRRQYILTGKSHQRRNLLAQTANRLPTPVQCPCLARPLGNRQRHMVRIRIFPVPPGAFVCYAPRRTPSRCAPPRPPPSADGHPHPVRVREPAGPSRNPGGICIAPWSAAVLIPRPLQRLVARFPPRRLHPVRRRLQAAVIFPPRDPPRSPAYPHSAWSPPATAASGLRSGAAERSPRRRQKLCVSSEIDWSTYALLTARTACAAGVSCACTAASVACAAAGATRSPCSSFRRSSGTPPCRQPRRRLGRAHIRRQIDAERLPPRVVSVVRPGHRQTVRGRKRRPAHRQGSAPA